MKITLQRFGEDHLEIDPDSVITFPHGLPGFDNCTRYKLLHEEGDGKPSIFWLQSLDDPGVVLSLTDPGSLGVSYEITLSDDERDLLQADLEDELVLAMVVAKESATGTIAPVSAMRLNTHAPIILNPGKRLGLQKQLHDFKTEVSIRGS